MLEEASLEGQDTDSSRHCFVEWSVRGQTRTSLCDDKQDGQVECPPEISQGGEGSYGQP